MIGKRIINLRLLFEVTGISLFIMKLLFFESKNPKLLEKYGVYIKWLVFRLCGLRGCFLNHPVSFPFFLSFSFEEKFNREF